MYLYMVDTVRVEGDSIAVGIVGNHLCIIIIYPKRCRVVSTEAAFRPTDPFADQKHKYSLGAVVSIPCPMATTA